MNREVHKAKIKRKFNYFSFLKTPKFKKIVEPLRLLWIGLIISAAILTAIKNKHIELPDGLSLKLPQFSVDESMQFITKYEIRTDKELSCDVEIISNNAPNTIFILLEPKSEKKVALIYVGTGESINLKVPEGTYKYQMVEGTNWINEQELFGPLTGYRRGDRLLTFRPGEKQTIKLKTIEGNMHPIRAGKINLN